jgi:hypothetical protein
MNKYDCFDCFFCYDEGMSFEGANSDNFMTKFCSCPLGVSLESEYGEWYAQFEMNEYTLENA